MLFALRTRTSKLHCPLRCWGTGEQPSIDTQAHTLECKKLPQSRTNAIATEKVEYSHIFSEIKKQKEVVVVIKQLLEEKEKLCPPGDKLDPSTVSSLCCSNNNHYVN